MTNLGHLALNTLDMIKHHPIIFQSTLMLHLLYYLIDSTSISINQHFENKNLLFRLLPRKTTTLNVFVTTKLR